MRQINLPPHGWWEKENEIITLCITSKSTKKHLEIEIFGPLVNDTHIVHIFVNDYILPSLSTP